MKLGPPTLPRVNGRTNVERTNIPLLVLYPRLAERDRMRRFYLILTLLLLPGVLLAQASERQQAAFANHSFIATDLLSEFAAEEMRHGRSPSPWRYPAWGAVIGGLVGAAAGSYLMYSMDGYIAPPAHILTVPAGVVVGAYLGWVVDPRRAPTD
jgi:peptidoglycan/LPS O-acetylase OafA/YrhL